MLANEDLPATNQLDVRGRWGINQSSPFATMRKSRCRCRVPSSIYIIIICTIVKYNSIVYIYIYIYSYIHLLKHAYYYYYNIVVCGVYKNPGATCRCRSAFHAVTGRRAGRECNSRAFSLVVKKKNPQRRATV